MIYFHILKMPMDRKFRQNLNARTMFLQGSAAMITVTIKKNSHKAARYQIGLGEFIFRLMHP